MNNIREKIEITEAKIEEVCLLTEGIMHNHKEKGGGEEV